MNPTYTLSAEGARQIKAAVAEAARRLNNVANRVDVVENDHQAPQVYAAYTPGVISGIGGLVPGHGECAIYQILDDDTTGVPVLTSVFNLTQRVHNLSANAIPANSWLPVWRDGYGKWLALSTAQPTAGSTQLGTGWFGYCASWGSFNAAYQAAQIGTAPPLDYDGNPLTTVGQKTLVLRLALGVFCPFDAGAVLSIGYAYLTSDWNVSTGYDAGALVCNGGNLYYALVANVGVAPPSACFWLPAGTCPVDNLTAITDLLASPFDLTVADNTACQDGLCLKLDFDSRFPVQIVTSTGLDGSLTKGAVQIMLETLSSDPCTGCDQVTSGVTAGYCGSISPAIVGDIGSRALCYNNWLYVPATVQVQIDSNVDFGGTIPAYTPLNNALVTLTLAGTEPGLYDPFPGDAECVWTTGDTNVCEDTVGTQDAGPTATLVYGQGACNTGVAFYLFRVPLVQVDLTTLCQNISTGAATNPDPSAGNISLPNGGVFFPAHVIVDDTWGVATACCSPVPFVLQLRWLTAGCPSDHVTLTWDPTQLVNPVYADCPGTADLDGFTAAGAWVGSGGGHDYRLFCANGVNDPMLLQGLDGFPGPGWWLEVDGAVSTPCTSCTRGCNPFFVTFYSCAGNDCACPITVAAPSFYSGGWSRSAPLPSSPLHGAPGAVTARLPVADAGSAPAQPLTIGGRPAITTTTDARPSKLRTCRFIGPLLLQESGRPVTQGCQNCGDQRKLEQLKVFACSHPTAGPQTDAHKCQGCPFWAAHNGEEQQ